MSPFVSEIVGTFLLILLGVGINANVSLNHSYGKNAGWVVTCLGWGFAVFVAVVVAAPYSGAHINPAVTLGLAVAGLFEWSKVPEFMLAQMIGAGLGATVAWLAYRGQYAATEDPATKLGTFSTGPAIPHPFNNVMTEMIGTFVLMFVILYFTPAKLQGGAVDGVKVGLGSIGALPVALLVTVIGMGLGGPTGFAINPARDLGPRIMHAVLPIPGKGSSNWGYAWVPVFGPLLGATIAAGLYLVIT